MFTELLDRAINQRQRRAEHGSRRRR